MAPFDYLEKGFREMSLEKKPLFILGDLIDDLIIQFKIKIIEKDKFEINLQGSQIRLRH